MSDTVAIIGGGPAGMMAAAMAAKRGKTAVIIEKNATLGKKLLITGKGRCNITNNCDISEAGFPSTNLLIAFRLPLQPPVNVTL